MRHFLLICCVLFCQQLYAAPSSAATAVVLSPESSQRLQKLTQNKLKQSLKVLQEIPNSEHEQLLALYQALIKGQLYFIKSSGQLIKVVKSGSNKSYTDVFSAKVLEPQAKKAIKKIRVNNKIRVYLRQLLAKQALSDEDPKARLSALRAVLKELNAQSVQSISELRLTEKNIEVQQMMDVIIDIDRARNATLKLDKIAAIDRLGESLEPQVRTELVQIQANSAAPKVLKALDKALLNIDESRQFYGYLDQLFFGLSLGSVLLLAAIGLAITFGMMGVINMAHGEMIMLGAYTTYVVQLLLPNFIEYSLWVAVPLAFVVAGSVGILIERCVIRFLHGRPLETLLATFGISLILQQLVRSIFSPLNRQVESPAWMSGSWEINPIFSLTLNRLYILAFALLVFFALLFILKKTSLGLNVRAVSQNRGMAKALGIRTDRVDAMTFGLGSGIAGIAGVALSQLTNVGPNLGQAYIIDSFMVVVFGGVGNLLGTLVAAFSLGIANKILEPATGAVLASILVLVFIILFIQKRPKGLFPQKGRAAE